LYKLSIFRPWLLVLTLVASPLLIAAEPVIGFVDIAYLIDNSPQSLQARQRLEEEFLPRQQELAELREEKVRLDAKLANLASDEVTAIADIERETRALTRRTQRVEQAFREDLNVKRNRELKKVRDQIIESVNAFARDQGFDLVLTDGVLFASTSVDITQRVLETLRAK